MTDGESNCLHQGDSKQTKTSKLRFDILPDTLPTDVSSLSKRFSSGLPIDMNLSFSDFLSVSQLTYHTYLSISFLEKIMHLKHAQHILPYIP
jgi:hypothetical protein